MKFGLSAIYEIWPFNYSGNLAFQLFMQFGLSIICDIWYFQLFMKFGLCLKLKCIILTCNRNCTPVSIMTMVVVGWRKDSLNICLFNFKILTQYFPSFHLQVSKQTDQLT